MDVISEATSAPVSPPSSTVTLTGISYSYHRSQALSDVNVRLSPGVTALVGVNGAGKTTLLNLMATALSAQSGQIDILGDLVTRRTRRDVRRHVGLMPQEPSFPGNFTVAELVAYVGWLRGMSSADARRSAAQCVDNVDLGNHARTPIRQLSGGMRRRVGLAQALVNDPQILLLDEPTTGLDPEQRMRVRELVEHTSLARTVVVSSHLVEDVVALASHIVVLHEGKVAYSGPMSRLTEAANHDSGRQLESAFINMIRPSIGEP